jgi:apolipoprotein N-acyltransferase
VAIVQGAIPQDQKWLQENRELTLQRYRELTEEALGSSLIVWPEAAIPDLANNVVPYLQDIARAADERGSALLMGLIRAEPVAERAMAEGPAGADARTELAYFNSILVLADEVSWYDKHHLVPFGEFFPVPDFVRAWLRLMSLPYSDFTRGAAVQPPLQVAGLRLSASICYEDAYPTSLHPSVRESTALVNVTNDAWFGESSARYQHLQISRMRALEAQRYLIRAANDGVSAVIGPRGEIVAAAPEYEPAVLRADVVPRTGLSPYLRVGNLPWLLWAILALGAALWQRRRTELP